MEHMTKERLEIIKTHAKELNDPTSFESQYIEELIKEVEHCWKIMGADHNWGVRAVIMGVDLAKGKDCGVAVTFNMETGCIVDMVKLNAKEKRNESNRQKS